MRIMTLNERIEEGNNGEEVDIGRMKMRRLMMWLMLICFICNM